MSDSQLYPSLFESKCIKIDDKIWFCATNYNAICTINIRNGKITLVATLKSELFDKKILSINLIKWNNKIIFIPMRAKYINFYDIKNGKIDLVEERKIDHYSRGGSYYNAFIKDDFCYAIPVEESLILKINLKSRCIESTIDIEEKCCDKIGESYRFLSKSNCYEYKNILYFAMSEKPYIIAINLMTDMVWFYKLNLGQCGLAYMDGVGRYIYILTRNGEIILWDIEYSKICDRALLKLKMSEITRYYRSFFWNGYMYFFKYFASDEFIKMNHELGEYKVCNIRKEWEMDLTDEDSLIFLIMEEGKCYFYLEYYELIIVDLQSSDVTKINLQFNDEKINQYVERCVEDELRKGILKGEIIREGKFVWNLCNILKESARMNLENTNVAFQKNSTIGVDIYQNMKDLN